MLTIDVHRDDIVAARPEVAAAITQESKGPAPDNSDGLPAKDHEALLKLADASVQVTRAAYRLGRERADKAKSELDKAYAQLEDLKEKHKAGDPAVKPEQVQTAQAAFETWVELNSSKSAALQPLRADLQVSAAAARLLGSPEIRSKVDALVNSLLDGKNSDNALASALDALSAAVS
jgi:hypothetical protein